MGSRAALALLLWATPLTSVATPEANPGSLKRAEMNNVSYAAVTQQAVRPEDQRLSYGDDPLQFALAWRASGTTRGRVILVHGGCWLNQYNLDHTRALATALSESGFETWSVEYRRAGDPGGGWPGSLQDVVSSLSAILNLPSQSPTVVVGHSAGGHLALLAAAHIKQPIHTVIGLAAITDMTRYAAGSNSCQQAARVFMGGSPDEKPDAYREASVRDTVIPTVLLHGDADTIVPLEQTEVDGAVANIVGDAGHFDWVHTSTNAYTVLLDTLNRLLDP